MSTLPHPVTDARLAGFAFCRAPLPRREEALSLLLTGAAQGSRAAVANFLEFAAEQKLGLDHLWAAYRGGPQGSIAAAVLLVTCAGRSAMAFLSPLQPGDSPAPAAALVRAACRGLDPQQTCLVQGLLEPAQHLEADIYRGAGFQQLATLVYMHRTAQASDLPPRLEMMLDPGIEVVHFEPRHRPLFAAAVLASYEDTLDCPDMRGLRDIEDVLDGHMAIGEFVPSLWMALLDAGRPAGVMMLNPVLNGQAMELVYLGLSKPWRGRGLARRLLGHGLGLTRLHSIGSMILAVDECNVAALGLYRSLGFDATQRKTAWVMKTGQVSSSKFQVSS